MDESTCKECNEVFNSAEQVRRHLRKHSMTAQEYSLKWDHGNIIPKCACNCGQETSWNVAAKAYVKFVHGHHAWGRKKSDDEKRKIGEANRVNMKRYMAENPSVARAKAYKMTLAGMNESSNAKRSASIHRFWSSGSDLSKQRRDEASLRAIALLEQNKIGPHAPFKQMWIDNPFTGQAEYMHSSWEIAFLTQCIREGYPVTKQHGIVIDYQQIDGSWHRYVPDFKALEESVLFEVKGNLTPNDELKLQAAESAGYEVVLVQA